MDDKTKRKGGDGNVGEKEGKPSSPRVRNEGDEAEGEGEKKPKKAFMGIFRGTPDKDSKEKKEKK